MIEYRTAEQTDFEAIRTFLVENGWQERVADRRRFETMMKNASRTIVAFSDGKIVGFARALCDDASNGYIGTVAVAGDWQRQGIGTEMVHRLMGDNPNISWVLRSGRDSDEFWRKIGFVTSTVAMERRRHS